MLIRHDVRLYAVAYNRNRHTDLFNDTLVDTEVLAELHNGRIGHRHRYERRILSLSAAGVFRGHDQSVNTGG